MAEQTQGEKRTSGNTNTTGIRDIPHILELLAICLVLAVVLATFLKYLLIILEKLAAIGHALKNLWNSAKQRRAERNLKEISDFSQLVAERAKTLSPTICEMAKNGVSVNFDVAAFARSV